MVPPDAAAKLETEAEADDLLFSSGILDRPRAPAPAASPRSRRAARLRRWGARALLFVFPVAVIALDVARRKGRIFAFEGMDLWFYLGSALLGVVFWVSLLAAATRPKGAARWPVRVLVAIVALLAVGGQLYTYARYGAYVNHRAVLVGTSFLPSVGQQLWFDRWTFAATLLPCVGLAVAVPLVAGKVAPMRRRARGWLCLDVALLATLIAAFVSPERGAEQGQPPDVMYVSAMGQLARAHWDHNDQVERVHPGRRTPSKVPPLEVAIPAGATRRNVVMIITESVRAPSVCVGYSDDCKWTPMSNQVVRDRIPITQMRALDSTTAISLAVMWNGLVPTAKREDLHTAPLLWEYAKAAGYGTAYYTSQHMLFGNSGTWLEGAPFDRHVSATHIEEDATYEIGADDYSLVERVLGDMDALAQPYFAVVHLSNTHFPYKIDADYMPFEPEGDTEIVDRYQDAIYLQDRALEKLLRGLEARPEAKDTVIAYVSDHGEQLREKGTVGHTGSLFEPEIRVPFWIHAPEGTLTATEEKSLRDLETTPVTELEVFPTMLDLLGLWDAPGIARFREQAGGTSLLRAPPDPNRTVLLSNCTELWACAFKNWGAMRGTKKLIARQGDRAWSCYDIATDPTEDQRLESSECGDMADVVERSFGGRPF